MGIKSPINIKILNDTHDIMTLMTHGCVTLMRNNQGGRTLIHAKELYQLTS